MGARGVLAGLAMLSESLQEQALAEATEKLVINGEYARAEAICEWILNDLEGYKALKSKAALISIQIACRLKDIGLALARLDALDMIADASLGLNTKSGALIHVCALLIPDYPGRVHSLWQKCMAGNLPFHAQYNLAKIGLALVRIYLKFGAREEAEAVREVMADKLTMSACSKILENIARDIAKAGS